MLEPERGAREVFFVDVAMEASNGMLAKSRFQAVREVISHGGVRDDLRSKAMERADHLPTEADAVDAALAAYAEARSAR